MSHYKPYPAYKDSGVEWLGRVPEHWGLRRLKHMARFSGGGTPSRDNADFWNGNIPWVSPKDMKAEVISGAEEAITPKGLAGSSSSLVSAGHVLMVVRSGILKHTIPVAINDVPVALNQDMKAIRLDSNYLTERFFMRWVQGLNDELLKDWLKQGATVESIEQEYLANSWIVVPPGAERERILKVLDRETARIDALIEKKTRFIELLREKRQALITHAVTKGLDPNVKMKNSGVEWLGEVPEHWVVKRFRDICLSISTGPFGTALGNEDYVTGGVPVINPSHIVDEHCCPDPDITVSAETAERLSFWAMRTGDLVTARRGELGRAAVICDEQNGWICGTGSLRVRPNPGQAIVGYLHTVLQSRYAREWLNLASVGATMANLNEGILGSLPLVLPPSTAEQEKLLALLEVQSVRLSKIEQRAADSVALLKERRSALITAAVTGQIDLRESA
ncbi:type I restriction-modification system subunit S [Pseudomonas knackmussii B13]|uniref:Type I restriction-modification system subunit S n=1 Tax=Pseudomonas knackmussii (strain DSM 6978 / CCUG 54928 / LMG 23759 / B13) TaxID=1301098 RepID=A0A024HAJ4_PSEKB|nr:restriction endonuclease subunit S [Pseudomonas knackmussii]CDF81901.1 type I restriction-modification system subunit S [Pseudomonas knackmussii B13]